MRVDSVTRLLCLLMLTQRTASYMPGLVGRRGAVPLRRASKIAAKAAAAPPKYITEDVGNNVTPYIENLVGRGLHRAEAHPLGIIKAKIEEYFQGLDGPAFEIVDDLDPLVQAQACFDDLLIPKDHPGRLPSDTYYVSRPGGREVSASTDVLLRTHTSAHQSQLLRDGKEAFLCTGDVYRRDEIDASHFPAFHQMEGVKLFPPADVGGAMTREEWLASPGCELIAKDLKKTLEGLCDHLFGDCEKRWIDEYFPFTEPSFELEIYYNGDWMEVLGCGVVHSGVLENVGLSDRHGWAFGLGLERLAMVLFSIPDVCAQFGRNSAKFLGATTRRALFGATLRLTSRALLPLPRRSGSSGRTTRGSRSSSSPASSRRSSRTRSTRRASRTSRSGSPTASSRTTSSSSAAPSRASSSRRST